MDDLDLSAWDVLAIWFLMWVLWVGLLSAVRALGRAWRNE